MDAREYLILREIHLYINCDRKIDFLDINIAHALSPPPPPPQPTAPNYIRLYCMNIKMLSL